MIIYLNGNDSIYYSLKPIVNTWYETELTVYYVIVKEINFTISSCLIRKKYYIALNKIDYFDAIMDCKYLINPFAGRS